MRQTKTILKQSENDIKSWLETLIKSWESMKKVEKLSPIGFIEKHYYDCYDWLQGKNR